MTSGTPLHSGAFVHYGRGPSLERAHWDRSGTLLRAIDYYNPEVAHDRAHLKHVRFRNLQVTCITPEEVIGSNSLGDLIMQHPGVAMFDRGRSSWVASFSPRHLGQCHHYQLLFYDELVEVIADGVEIYRGGYDEAVEQGVEADEAG